ncbi:hypothetical protein D0864_06408 [Hortaea werneckii]|uniref:histidine kinase n=1 Tax=Hortaea werneckii TaxID=91943 RepID=A0A3M7FLA8_HORWE|nr:hypothetical protein D0864_06408 [Hortaea werneckii]
MHQEPTAAQERREIYRAWQTVHYQHGDINSYLTTNGKILYAIAQLATCRLGTQGALISLSTPAHIHVLEATRTLSPGCDKATAETQLLVGQRSLRRGHQAGLCEFSPSQGLAAQIHVLGTVGWSAGRGIRFYAAVPVLSGAGTQLGALVVWDNVPRPDLGEGDIQNLREYAECIWRHLDMVRQGIAQTNGAAKAICFQSRKSHGEHTSRISRDRTESGRSGEILERDEFLSGFSHELRNPIHGILGSAQFLQDTVSSDYQNIHFGLSSLLLDTLNLVLEHNQLHLAKISANQATELEDRSSSTFTPAKPVGDIVDADLALLVERTADTVVAGHFFDSLPDIADSPETELSRSRSRHKRGGIDRGSTQNVRVVLMLDARPNWSVKVQPGVFSRILMNLVSNALKFTHSGVVEVALEHRSALGESPMNLRLRVSDTGIGMSQLFQRDNLFAPFRQENQFAPGIGLGMNVLKALIASLGGSLNVGSQQKLGTTVTVDLSLEASDTRDEGLPQDILEVVNSLRGKHLVLLDVGPRHDGPEQSAATKTRVD